jgi:hypothetical protein
MAKEEKETKKKTTKKVEKKEKTNVHEVKVEFVGKDWEKLKM